MSKPQGRFLWGRFALTQETHNVTVDHIKLFLINAIRRVKENNIPQGTKQDLIFQEVLIGFRPY